jgi:hypothetical protein
MRRLHSHISPVRGRLLALGLVAFCTLALMATAVALAQTPTVDAYGGLAGSSQGSSSGGGQLAQSPAGSDTGGSLPFTGLELGAFVVVGAGLVGTGLVLRRTTRSHEQTQ